MMLLYLVSVQWVELQGFLKDDEKVGIARTCSAVFQHLRRTLPKPLPPCLRMLHNWNSAIQLPQVFLRRSLSYGVSAADVAAVIGTCRLSYQWTGINLDFLWVTPDEPVEHAQLLQQVPWITHTRLDLDEEFVQPNNREAFVYRLYKESGQELGGECWGKPEKR